MRYPINWVLGAVLFGAVCIVVGGVLVAIAIGRVVRRKRWPAEWERRRAQATVLAHVDDCTTITDQHVRLTLTIEERITDGYREPRRVRLRGIVLLPPGAVAELAIDSKVPVRFDPAQPSASTIDFAALTGTAGSEAERDERDAYLQFGPKRWEIS